MQSNMFFAIAIIHQVFVVSWSKVVVSVHFSSYSNPQGVRADGRACDTVEESCDHRFFICFDSYDRNIHDLYGCHYYQKTTGVFDDTFSFNFDDYNIEFTNPILLNVSEEERGVVLKVAVYDYDTRSSADLIDSFYKPITIGHPYAIARNSGSAQPITEEIVGRENTRSRLSIQVSIYCAKHYFPQNGGCQKYCKELDDGYGDYICDENGDKICVTGSQCLAGPGECLSETGRVGKCERENTAKCIRINGLYTCQCKPGFSGARCEFTKSGEPGVPQTSSEERSSSSDNKDKIALIAGLVVGFLVLILIVLVIVTVLIRKRLKQLKKEEHTLSLETLRQQRESSRVAEGAPVNDYIVDNGHVGQPPTGILPPDETNQLPYSYGTSEFVTPLPRPPRDTPSQGHNVYTIESPS